MWTLDNTEGYTQKQLDHHNENYKKWIKQQQLEDSAEAQGLYFDRIMC